MGSRGCRCSPASRWAWSVTPRPHCSPRRDGEASPFAGYKVTGFSNAEETQGGLADKAKWLLQDRLVELGVDYQEGEPWAPKVVVDRNLYTGQNPASSAPLAAEMVKSLGVRSA